jgi:serine/threonine protein kinase
MDRYKSLELEKILKGTKLNDYKVIEFINNGKSAAVFKAEKSGKFFALKIFDNEMIERFGHEIQTRRIEQEILLKNHSIENLVKIYEGGKATVDEQQYYYIIMELIEGCNLKDYISKNQYNQDFIVKVLNRLIITTEQLLIQKNIVHRDIKPENIMINQEGEIILMDLGVLKFIGATSLSDEDEVSFVGTLRYAPPEFLLRNEENSIQGWKAVNLYQIGATLHDLIMKYELFKDEIPYSKLVLAINQVYPVIECKNLSYEIIQMARNMLAKEWKKRLQLVTDEKLKAIYSLNHITDDFEISLNNLMKLREKPQALSDEIISLVSTNEEKKIKKNETGKKLHSEIKNCFFSLKKLNIFNELIFSQNNFHLNEIDRNNDEFVQNILFVLKGNLPMGYPKPLYVFVRLSNDHDSYCKVQVNSFFDYSFNKFTIEEPIKIIQEVFKASINNSHQYSRLNKVEIKLIDFYEGIVDFDENFNKSLMNQFIKLIEKSLSKVSILVEDELIKRKSEIESKMPSGATFVNQKSIIIDSLD